MSIRGIWLVNEEPTSCLRFGFRSLSNSTSYHSQKIHLPRLRTTLPLDSFLKVHLKFRFSFKRVYAWSRRMSTGGGCYKKAEARGLFLHQKRKRALENKENWPEIIIAYQMSTFSYIISSPLASMLCLRIHYLNEVWAEVMYYFHSKAVKNWCDVCSSSLLLPFE